MKRFLPGRRPPRPSAPPSPPPRRRPPPPPSEPPRPAPPRWAARLAAARPAYGASSPCEAEGEAEVTPRDGAARRPEDCWAARRAAARPPPCGCDVLRRCSLIERLLLGQARAPGSGR
ncbi:hypothetical protein DNK56_00605 [Streptomyces sp. AC1-42W]|nr:hypothetical protein DNK55_13405 [Streptomyces sp. AC1-42T]PZT80702.1 hypothetical protein DNK56_00030 [Streptomyces sp. AC1-42W]PZT80796.1 hypothetical protein DNK56_00605 [Streptomyces sp. AC1-42W]